VKATFDTVKQALPTVENIETFVSGHPVAIAQLSIQYCNTLVDDTSARAAYFPGFNFAAVPTTAFGSGGRGVVVDSLLNRMMLANMGTDPDPADVRNELDSLITRLTACGSSCPAGRTPTVVKATCAAMLGSAVTLIN
jgi:hypothetical protein